LPTKLLYTFLFPPCPALLIILHLITLKYFMRVQIMKFLTV
jgi:hypothetical protein